MSNNNGHRNISVLLVEDSLPIRQRVRSLIEESGHARIIGEAGTVASALALFRDHQPDAVVLDLHLAEGTGYSVLEEIKLIRPDCNVIVLTNFIIPEYRDRCRTLGADHFFEKSKDFERVPQVLARLSRAVKPAGHILIADDEVMVGKALTQILQSEGYDCEWVPSSAEALLALSRSRFDLLIADINMPGNRRLELLQELPQLAPGLPVILLTGDPCVESAATAVRLNAKAYLQKPPDLVELKTRVSESIANYRVHQSVQRKWHQFQTLSQDLDRQLAVPLTGLAEPGEIQELENLFRVVDDVVRAGHVSTSPDLTHLIQHQILVSAVRETISVLETTKRSFKSKPLGQLRERLETLMNNVGLNAATPLSSIPDGGHSNTARAT